MTLTIKILFEEVISMLRMMGCVLQTRGENLSFHSRVGGILLSPGKKATFVMLRHPDAH